MHSKILNDIFAIWQAGVAGVAPDRLVRDAVQCDPGENVLWVQDEDIPMQNLGRIVVVGAGKASASMAVALEEQILPFFDRNRMIGWVNVPEDCLPDCTSNATQTIHLHGARPPGVNEPTREGLLGTQKIWELLRSLQPNDLCFCLLSGGGSALLPAPISEITLEEKRDLTRFLSQAGANIEQLNTVRKHLSWLKGGGIRRLCAGRRLITLILSDVLGDPLDLIASGPTVPDTTTLQNALDVMRKFGIDDKAQHNPFAHIFAVLLKRSKSQDLLDSRLRGNDGNTVRLRGNDGNTVSPRGNDEGEYTLHRNLVLGNNAVAVDAAGIEAEKRGFSHVMVSAKQSEGAAEDIGIHLLEQVGEMLRSSPFGPNCLISGGEPTVRLPKTGNSGKGGRNQHLVLAALVRLLRLRTELLRKEFPDENGPLNFAMLSAGTDGEDGPTDAAGAYFDDVVFRNVLHLMSSEGLNPQDYLDRCDSYHFFERVGGLLKTGPTGTNVCDLRVVALSSTAQRQKSDVFR